MKTRIPYRDLSVTDNRLKDRLLEAVGRVLSHGRIILGPEVDEFEKRVAEYCQREYAVAVNSGTDALYFALRAADIGSGDEVITTPLSWIATANSIVLTGATPVYVDIREDLNINTRLIESAISRKTRAILPVHFTGKMCDMNRINKIAEEHNLIVIEDAAQAFGSKLNGKLAGSYGHMGCFSMNPMKVFNSYGEAGAVVTDDQNIYDKFRSLRYAGTINKEDCHFPSLNGRMDTLQAAMMLVNLEYLERKILKRREIAEYYNSELDHLVTCPEEDKRCFHTFYSYTILTGKRDGLKDFLDQKGIETKIQHPILMPFHSAYKHLPKPDIPFAENLVQQVLCIPNHEDLSVSDLEYIVGSIQEFFIADSVLPS